MLFQSQVFVLAFLPLVLALWYAPWRAAAPREWVLLALSLGFYGWWDPRFIPLLLGQAVGSWLVSRAYLASGRRSILIAGVAANLAVLAFFKYAAFLAGNLVALTGIEVGLPGIILPIGISFFTFEIVSYLVDLGWRGAPPYPLRRFLIFVAFFPRLIAGPIVRHNEILPQLDLDPRREGLAERLSQGATLFVIGFAKKVLLADRLAPIADTAFAGAGKGVPDLATAWSGSLAFSLQLFLDFSAYSEMAIGVALMLGLALPVNFEMPYRAVDLRDFWRRWHMTLSRYLRDYLYIPLGGSREGPARFIFATIITMGLCGLWHGAGWTFVAWGLLHGVGLVVCRGWSASGIRLPIVLSWLVTMLFVLAGWVLFRAPDFATALRMLEGLVGRGGTDGGFEGGVLIAVAAAVSLIGWSGTTFVYSRLQPSPILATLVAALAVYCVLEVGKGQPQTFIYFQF